MADLYMMHLSAVALERYSGLILELTAQHLFSQNTCRSESTPGTRWDTMRELLLSAAAHVSIVPFPQQRASHGIGGHV